MLQLPSHCQSQCLLWLPQLLHQQMHIPLSHIRADDVAAPVRVIEDPSAPPAFISSQKPTMVELLKLRVPQQVGESFDTFGTLLLRDQSGKMESFRNRFHNDSQVITREVLKEWLKGRGVKVSWENLISTLVEADLFVAAKQIREAWNEHK